MSNTFFADPILNSPYEYPKAHWELDDDGQPTHEVVATRRRARFITPIPAPRKRKAKEVQVEAEFNEGPSTADQQYKSSETINAVREMVDKWRAIPNSNDWHVTPVTATLLRYWRTHEFNGPKPFFCQLEAVETAIWLTEVAPKMGKQTQSILKSLEDSNLDANPELSRLSLKLATGAGKTTVMAMLIAWQTVNAARTPNSKKFTRGFLIVTPGITIRDRLRVLQPNDPESYYESRELVPRDMLPEMFKAKIVITNYHAFKLRERLEISKGGRLLLQGRGGAPIETIESEGQLIQRVMPELMSMRDVLVINDEAHHCYREKPLPPDAEVLKGDEREEAEENNEAARLWISGIEMVKRKLGIQRVLDLSATPFFLRGSGYAEGTIFPWTMSDFSLMDAIECGIVKLPRVPISENIPGNEMPVFRNLWEHISADMPKKGRKWAGELDPLKIPVKLQTALEALYGIYRKTFDTWQAANMASPPCFIIVCQNTSISDLVFKYVSGFFRTLDDGTKQFENGKLKLFSNFNDDGTPLSRPNTLLIDSQQLEAGDALDDVFLNAASAELDVFRSEVATRAGDMRAGENLTDAQILREVMNTVGKEGKLGASIRCVVSVSMLTEGWDANTVTHVLGVRAFGTQLLCEQVIGRALRRQSYELNPDTGRFNVEYADVLGIPFDFTSEPVVVGPQPPRETVEVRAVRPERDHLAISFPRVVGYRTELPNERLVATFTADSVLELTPDLVGPTITHNAGIIGEGITLDLDHLDEVRRSTLCYHLTKHLVTNTFREPGEAPKLHLFGQLKSIAAQWLDQCLVCRGNTFEAQLVYLQLADMACERIAAAISKTNEGVNAMQALIDPFNPTGSSNHVRFLTSKKSRWLTDANKCQINWVVLDSDWEAEFCRIAEHHSSVVAYVKNHGLHFEIPYRSGAEQRTYIPDFIVLVDDGRGTDDLLHLIVEIKGFRNENAKDKKLAVENYWIPGINNAKTYGRWAFLELTSVWDMNDEFGKSLTQVAAIVENAS